MRHQRILHSSGEVAVHAEESTESSDGDIWERALEHLHKLGNRRFSDWFPLADDAKTVAEHLLSKLRDRHGPLLLLQPWA